MRKNLALFTGIALIYASMPVQASETVTLEPDQKTYHFVSSYAVVINAPANLIWPQLLDLGSWMNEFEMDLISGDPGKEGAVYRLYPGQEFYTEITKAVPGELLVLANLPSTFQGELSTGIAVVSIHEIDSVTRVDLTMSRRYTWQGEGENPLLQTRQSQQFQENTRAMWQDRFLGRLRDLSEGRTNSGPQD